MYVYSINALVHETRLSPQRRFLSPSNSGRPLRQHSAETEPHPTITTQNRVPIDSPCECEHNNPDSLDARLFPTVVLAAAPAATMDEASSLLCFVVFTFTRGISRYALPLMDAPGAGLSLGLTLCIGTEIDTETSIYPGAIYPRDVRVNPTVRIHQFCSAYTYYM